MQKFAIKNIDCANCAAKIENNLSKLKEVKYVSINFTDSTMFIDTDNMSKVRKVVEQTEPGVELVDISPEIKKPELHISDKKENRRKIFFITLIAVIYTAGLIFRRQLAGTPYSIAEYAVFLTAYLLAGWDVLYSAGRKIIRGNLFDEHFLMSIATIGAIIIGELPEAVGVMIFYQVGEFMQQLSVKRSRSSIKSLLEIKPAFANIIEGENVRKTEPESVTPGQFVLIKPGEKVPLDGRIIEGSSQVDTSPLTGEPVPKFYNKGDYIPAGVINKSGSLTVKVTKRFEDSSIARMMDLVENAGTKKAETEKFITTFSRYYTPVVVAIAAVIAFVPPLVFGQNLSEWIYRALVILVISCPCALVISIPLGFFGGIGGASRKGILVKGSNFLDVLTRVKTVVFDKTGTLTQGVFRVNDIVPSNGYSKEEVLKFAATAEARSNHPIAWSITEAYKNGSAAHKIENYQEIPGSGIKVRIDDKDVIAGNDRLLHMEHIDHKICDLNESIVHVAVDKKYAGYIIISDELKEDARHTIKYLKNSGIKNIHLFTGDNSAVAKNIAEKLDIDHYYAELLPEQKVEKLEELIRNSQKGEKVAFIGDGINDAAVIARADVGIAMGALGSDAAIESADIVIMTDAPSKVGTAIAIARRTHKIVWQNIFFALGVKAFFILLGAFGFATMWEAVFADMGVALIAILNASRLLKQ